MTQSALLRPPQTMHRKSFVPPGDTLWMLRLRFSVILAHTLDNTLLVLLREGVCYGPDQLHSRGRLFRCIKLPYWELKKRSLHWKGAGECKELQGISACSTESRQA